MEVLPDDNEYDKARKDFIVSMYDCHNVGEYVYSNEKNTFEQLINEAIVYVESNDIFLFFKLLKKLNLMDFTGLSTKKLELLIYCCNKMIYLNQLNLKVFEKCSVFMNTIFSQIDRKLNLHFDWKLYYKLYFIIDASSFEFTIFKYTLSSTNQKMFFKRLTRFYSDMTQEDYDFIKNESYQQINHRKSYKGISLFIFFAPVKFLAKDAELQNLLFDFFKNKSSSFAFILKIFNNLIRNKNQLLINIEEFITFFFAFLSKYIAGTTGLPFQKKTTTDNQKQKSEYKCIEMMCLSLLFDNQLIKYRDTIDEHFKLLIPIIHFSLKENYSDSHDRKPLEFLDNFTHQLKHFCYTRHLNDFSNKFVYTIKKDDKELMDRYKVIVGYLSPVIQKLVLFNVKHSRSIITRIYNILSFEPFDQNYINWLKFFLDDPETFIEKFISKLNCVIINLLREHNFKNEIASLIFKSIDFMQESISSNNPIILNSILYCFTKIYDYCTILKTASNTQSNPNYVKLLDIMEKQAVKICKKLLPIYDMLTVKMKGFNLFFYSMTSFLTKDKVLEISNEFSSYILEHEIDNKYVHHYFTGVTNSKMLWKWCYDSLIYVDKSKPYDNTIEKPQWFLYDIEKDIGNYDIEILTHNEKRLLYFECILLNLNFCDFEMNDAIKRQIKIMIYAFLYQKDNKYNAIGVAVFRSLLRSLLQANLTSERITYPNLSQLNYANELIRQLIIPYETYIEKTIDEIYNKIDKTRSKQDQKTEGASYANSLINDSFEKIIRYYLKYQNVLMGSIINYFINDQEDFPTNKYMDYNQTLGNELAQYSLINKHISKFSQMNMKIVRFNKYCNVIQLNNTLYLIYSITAHHLNQMKTCSKMPQTETLLNDNYLMIPSMSSIYNHWFKKGKYTFHQYLFSNIAKKVSYVNNMKMLLSNYDSSVYLYQKHIYQLQINYPEEEIMSLIDHIFQKYTGQLLVMDETLLSDKNKMCIIIENLLSLMKLISIIKPYYLIESTTQMITFVNLILSKNFPYTDYLSTKIQKVLVILSEGIIMKSNLLNVKLKAYPQIDQLLPLKLIENINYDNHKESLKEAIIAQKFQSDMNKTNHDLHVSNNIQHYYEHFYSNTLSSNIAMGMFLFTSNTIVLLNNFNNNNPNEVEQLVKYEKAVFKKIIEKEYSYEDKMIFLSVYGIILTHLIKSYKQYNIQYYTKEEYKANKAEIIKSSKGGLDLNENPIPYISKSFFNLPSSTNPSLEEMEAFCQTLDQIHDWIFDQKLISRQNNKDKPNGFYDIIKAIIQNQYIRDKSRYISFSNQADLKQNIRLLYYFICYYPGAFTYDMLNNHFGPSLSDFKNKENISKNRFSFLVCYLQIVLGLIRIDLRNHDYTNPRKVFEFFISYHTNGINQHVDSIVCNFIRILFTKCTINDIEAILPSDFNVIGKYSYSLVLIIYTYIGYVFLPHIKYYINGNQTIISLFHYIIDKYKTDPVKRVTNKNRFSSVLTVYLYGLEYLTEKNPGFICEFSPEGIEAIISLLSVTTEEGEMIFEVTNIISYLIYYNCDIFFENDELFNAFIKPHVELAAQEDKYISVSQKLRTAILWVKRPHEIMPMLKKIIPYLKKFQGQKPKVMIFGLIYYVMSLNIHYFTNVLNSTELFTQLLLALDCLNEEMKESFCEIFVTYFEMISGKENNEIIQAFRHYILGEEDGGNKYIKIINENEISKESIAYMGLAQLLRYRLTMPSVIQELVIDLWKYFNKVNNKGKEAKIIKAIVVKAMDKYHNSFVYLKGTLSEECVFALTEMSKTTSYFI